MFTIPNSFASINSDDDIFLLTLLVGILPLASVNGYANNIYIRNCSLFVRYQMKAKQIKRIARTFQHLYALI